MKVRNNGTSYRGTSKTESVASLRGGDIQGRVTPTKAVFPVRVSTIDDCKYEQLVHLENPAIELAEYGKMKGPY